MNRCPLVAIEWEDSAQPIPGWAFLAELDAPAAVRCMSVGWLIHDDAEVKALAPNMGGLTDEASVQVSGVIRIPARCIVRITELNEPELSTSCPGPSSHPVRERTRRASLTASGSA